MAQFAVCLNADYQRGGWDYYPTEVIQGTCPEVEVDDTTQVFDLRYTVTNSQLPTVYYVQEQSGVYQTIASLPLYDTIMPSAETDKQKNTYQYFYRNVLYWDPACESSDFISRPEVLSLISTIQGQSTES